MTLRRRTLWWAAPAALAVAWVAHAWLAPAGARAPMAEPVYTDWQFNPYAAGAPLSAVQHNADAARSTEAAHARVQSLLERGSLRETEPDGDWGRWVAGELQPSATLRRRFDYLLTLLGEATPAELRHWIKRELTDTRSASAAQQVLAVWDRYLALQQHRYAVTVRTDDPSTWQAALAERSGVRQQHLGREWAAAFYADEEQQLASHAQEVTAGAPPSQDAGLSLLLAERTGGADDAAQLHTRRTQQLGAEAAERLRAEDQAWAAWERRLATSRAQLDGLARAPELSAPQRLQAQERLLAEHYQGQELVRARALLLPEG